MTALTRQEGILILGALGLAFIPAGAVPHSDWGVYAVRFCVIIDKVGLAPAILLFAFYMPYLLRPVIKR